MGPETDATDATDATTAETGRSLVTRSGRVTKLPGWPTLLTRSRVKHRLPMAVLGTRSVDADVLHSVL
jgi:hypothetical protein